MLAKRIRGDKFVPKRWKGRHLLAKDIQQRIEGNSVVPERT
jgi:hypothetical protein